MGNVSFSRFKYLVGCAIPTPPDMGTVSVVLLAGRSTSTLRSVMSCDGEKYIFYFRKSDTFGDRRTEARGIEARGTEARGTEAMGD